MRGRTIAAIAAAAALAACGSSGSHTSPGPQGGGAGGGGAGGGGAGGGGGTSPGGPGSQGPWPIANVTYGAAEGIRESPVVGLSTDEAQNRWAATPQALYLLRPGERSFRRYDAGDGLHLDGNPAFYCDDHPMASRADHCGGSVSSGAGHAITRIVGGGPNEVFVGYAGDDGDGTIQCPPKDVTLVDAGADYCDPARHSGKLDRVRVRADGKLSVDRMDLVANHQGGNFWHDRTVQSLAFDHFVHPHTLYVGTNHGVTMILPDRFRLPNPGEWYDAAYSEWMGDHLHARVCDPGPCPAVEGPQRMGDWAGLDVDGHGDLWHAGRWTAGLITWSPDPLVWVGRNGRAFALAFGDPYPLAPNAAGFVNEPVFRVAREGDSPHLTGVAVCPDGRVWFSSSGPSSGTGHTVAVWDGHAFTSFAATDLGLREAAVKDVVCLPDGRVVLGGYRTGAVVHDPATRTSKVLPGLPGSAVWDLEVDRMVKPPALHVATDGGAAALRMLP
jgi:hypothetical protein